MNDIASIDKNFKIETNINKNDIKFYDARVSPFKIYGIFYENGKFRRMPEEIAKTVSNGVYSLHANTAGGRVRFKTNSSYVAINAKMTAIGKMPHFALCGSAGFDLYVNGVYKASYVPPYYMTDGYEGVIELDDQDVKEIMINFPLYSDVCELYIGVCEDSVILPPEPYKTELPVVFYGSSVTQGGCASRPGTSYQGFISRELDTDYINLGFSGGARAEDEIADYIKTLNMSAFVYDYDYNAPDISYLKNTHEKMFKRIREANPTLPIVLVSMPKQNLSSVDLERLEVIRTTYQNALSSGDKKVYFIDGRTLMDIAGTEGTVDSVHPTDLGFFSMAKTMSKLLKNILK